MEHPISYRWHPAEDLLADVSHLASQELSYLASIWREQRAHLQGAATLRAFNEKLQREFAIETGLLERMYTLDRGITQILIERGIDAAFIPHSETGRDPELVAAMIRDHLDAVEGLFTFVKSERRLSTSYVKELHQALTMHQDTCEAKDTLGNRLRVPLLRGDYKKQPNNPETRNGSIHEYCPPEHVASEMDRLVDLYHAHEARNYPVEVRSAWLHHAFTQIHPFQDGNGRVARCLASLVFIKADLFPLVIRDKEEKGQYIDALEAADRGDLRPIVTLFAAAQKRALVNALGIEREVRREAERFEQQIEALQATLQRRREADRRDWEKSKQVATGLHDLAIAVMDRRAREVARVLEAHSPNYRCFTDSEPPGGPRARYFRMQIVETAKRLGYWANLQAFAAWVRMVLRTETQSDILLSFHGVGEEFRGILGVSACFFRRSETADGGREVVDLSPLANELFQVNYLEPATSAEDRFKRWLDEVLVVGVETWRRGEAS